MSKPNPNLPCSICKLGKRENSSCWCADCRRVRQRAKYAAAVARMGVKAKRRKLHPDSCNCGDPNCTGLTCNYVRQSA